jgi:phage baseplate assembly protein W
MADSPQLLRDLRLKRQINAWRPVYALATDQRRVVTLQARRTLDDIGVVGGRANLAQAIMLRLLTPRGELAELAHPDYGSRLHELIGRPNTENTRNLLRLFILESLQQEPRIDEVLEVEVSADLKIRNGVHVRLAVKPIGEPGRLDLEPFTLEL